MGRKVYIIHYFNFKKALPFFLVSFLGLVVVLAILFIAARVQTLRWNSGLMANPGSRRRRRVNAPQLIESFYEMVFSTTSVLFFLSLYYIIDARIAAFATYWTKYQDVLLLVFILLSVFLTNWFDSVLVKLTNIKEEKKASIRLPSSLYIVLILLYIRPLINGTGNYYIESRTRSMGRTDLIIDYLGKQYIIEMKIWHGEEYNTRGEKQLLGYLDEYHLKKGYMLSFKFNKKKCPGVTELHFTNHSIVEAVV